MQSTQTSFYIYCSLDTNFGFIISITYAISSFVALSVLSYLSYKDQVTQSMSAFYDIKVKTFAKDLWKKKKCFFPFIANIFDQSSDIGIIISLFSLSEFENKNNNEDHNCIGINQLFIICTKFHKFSKTL